jgi:transcriptional regulator with XRE-family HTH domain
MKSARSKAKDAPEEDPRVESFRRLAGRIFVCCIGSTASTGVSALTIYSWESGKSRPRKKQLAGLAAVRRLGKREARKRLEMLGEK